MLKVVSQNSDVNPLTPEMVEQITAFLNFPLHIYIARQLYNSGIKAEHVYPYLSSGGPPMNNIFNAIRDFERDGLAHGGYGQSVQVHKLPELGQFLTPELGQEGI